ncbi:Mitochondrial fusion and transport protein UGO1 [Nakaseomyces bracarensis]|uniref:Mitochondrial fusion and transport protein UGO1 n=1 Tax=Nakaseomyces bracarensis TaxID=273131 RepID=A0ABR4NZE7_9SACH
MNNVLDTQALRPYYDPETFDAGYLVKFNPDKGVVDSNGFTIASKLNIVKNSKDKGSGSLDPTKLFSAKRSANDGKSLFNFSLNFGSSSGDLGGHGSIDSIVKEFEWVDLLNVNKWAIVITQLLELFVQKYFKLLIQQPFEVTRLIQQVADFRNIINVQDISGIQRGRSISLSNLDNDDDIDYFPSSTPEPTNKNLVTDTNNDYVEDEGELIELEGANDEQSQQLDVFIPKHSISPESKHTLDIMNAILDEEGIRGLWKANNTNFIYQILSSTLEAWYTGFISPFLNIPDPYFVDLIHFPDCQSAIILSLSVGLLTTLSLIPIDLIRTRFIITALSGDSETITKEGDIVEEKESDIHVESRSLRHWIRSWSWRHDLIRIPSDLWILTVLHSVSNVTFSKLFDLLVYHRFHVDKYSKMTTYNTMKFISKLMELAIKLPVENLLRRCQVNFLTNSNSALKIRDRDQLIIRPRRYVGVWSTLKDRTQLPDLWNGWRVGLMSIACGYGFKVLNKLPGETVQEKF